MIYEPKPETFALHLREQKHWNKSWVYLLTGLHPVPTVFTDSRGSHVILMRSAPGLYGVRSGGSLKSVYIEH